MDLLEAAANYTEQKTRESSSPCRTAGSSRASDWDTAVLSRKHYKPTLWVPLSQCQPDRWRCHCNNESIDINPAITRVQPCFLIASHNDLSEWFPGFCCVLDGAAEPLLIHQSSISVSDRSAVVVFVQTDRESGSLYSGGERATHPDTRRQQHNLTGFSLWSSRGPDAAPGSFWEPRVDLFSFLCAGYLLPARAFLTFQMPMY